MEGLTQSKEFILHDFMHNHEGCDYDFQHLKKKFWFIWQKVGLGGLLSFFPSSFYDSMDIFSNINNDSNGGVFPSNRN